jgi:hypothetical protein
MLSFAGGILVVPRHNALGTYLEHGVSFLDFSLFFFALFFRHNLNLSEAGGRPVLGFQWLVTSDASMSEASGRLMSGSQWLTTSIGTFCTIYFVDLVLIKKN